MYKKTLIASLLISFIACKKEEKVISRTTSPSISTELYNKEGNTLSFFYESDSTIQLAFEGVVYELKRNRTASGVQHSNEKDTLTEWQGKFTFIRNGEKVFFAKQE